VGKLSEKQLTIVTIGVAIVLTGVFATLIYMDFQTIDEEKARIETADGNIRKAQTEIDRMREREKNVIIYREIVERDAKVLPDAEEINEFWRRIKEFKETSGVQIDRIDGLDNTRAGKHKGGQAITPLQIRLNVKADMGQLLKFLNLFENFERLVSITDLSIRANENAAKKGPDDRVRHDVTLSLTTYVYNPRGGSVKQVEIPNYERRKMDEEIQRGIRKNKNPNKETYQLKPSLERRDPLVNPRKPPETLGEGGKTLQQVYEEQKNLLDRLVLQYQFIEQNVEIERRLTQSSSWVKCVRITKQLDEQIKSLELEITKVRQQRLITIEELLEEFEAQVVAPFRKLQSVRVTRSDIPVRVSLREVRDCLESMRASFDKADYGKVLDAYQAYKIYREGRELAAEARRMEEEIIEIARRATVVSDFESRDVKISALIVGKARAVALINGKSVAEGDPIEAGSKIILKEVRSDGCTFLYEGVLIRRSTRKASAQ
jgi:Tfp pilus assembly protein PilO